MTRTLVAHLRVAEREALVYRRLLWSNLSWTFFQPLMYFAAFGLGVGELVDRGSSDLGLPYLDFVAPGILMASTMLTVTGDSLWPVMQGTTWSRTYHAMIATPIRPADVYGGHVAWLGVRAVLTSTAYLVAATLVGGVSSPLAVFAVPAAVLTALSFGAPLVAYSGSRESDSSFPLIMRAGAIPLFLFSGTVFPVDQLPDVVEPVAWVTPLWHGVEIARDLTTGHPTWAIAGHVAFLAAVTVVGWWVGTGVFERKLAP